MVFSSSLLGEILGRKNLAKGKLLTKPLHGIPHQPDAAASGHLQLAAQHLNSTDNNNLFIGNNPKQNPLLFGQMGSRDIGNGSAQPRSKVRGHTKVTSATDDRFRWGAVNDGEDMSLSGNKLS